MADLFRQGRTHPHDPLARRRPRTARSRILVLHVITPYPVTGLPPAELPYIPPPNLATETKKQLEVLVRRTLGARRGVESRVVRR